MNALEILLKMRFMAVLCVLYIIDITMLHAAGMISPAIQPIALKRMLDDDSSLQIIDVRSSDEYSAGHIPGAKNIPAPLISKHIDELAQVAGLVLYCNNLRFTRVAERLLMKEGVLGFFHLEGGFDAWENAMLPVVTSLR